MVCDEGLLQAYIDGELPTDQAADVSQHLARCSECQGALLELRESSRQVGVLLASLDPSTQEMATTSQARARFNAEFQPAGPALWDTVTRSLDAMKRSLRTSPAWRVAAVGVLALALLFGMFSFAPTRQALADFLGVFRVRKFAVINVDQARIEQLEEMEDLLESEMSTKPEFLREPGEPQVVADVTEAAALAGFQAKVPGELPEGASLGQVAVEVGPHMRMTVERNAVEAALAYLDLADVTLPPMEQVTVEVDVPAAVVQEYLVSNPYGERDASFAIRQAPSPAVDVPDGVDPQAMGEILLQVLGKQSDEARRIAQSIDWTSTFILPLPSDMVRSYDVQVDGMPGVILEETPGSDGYRRRKVLLWERDGVVYAVNATNLTAPTLLQIAESLR